MSGTVTAITESRRMRELRAAEAAMAVDWPEVSAGDLSIRRFEVSEAAAAFTRLRAAVNPGRERAVPAGTYTGLHQGGTLWMSDTPAERYDHHGFVRQVFALQAARVLVTGLGLGVIVRALATLSCVHRIDVVEINADLVRLLGQPVLRYGREHNTRIRVHVGDAYAGWRGVPAWDGEEVWRADAAWHDIWPYISGDNWADMKRIKRGYRARVAYQDCWLQDTCRRLA